MYGKGWPGADGERREHRVDLAVEPLFELVELLLLALLDLRDDDAVLGERRDEPGSRGATGPSARARAPGSRRELPSASGRRSSGRRSPAS